MKRTKGTELEIRGKKRKNEKRRGRHRYVGKITEKRGKTWNAHWGGKNQN